MEPRSDEPILGGRYRLVAVLGEGGMGTVYEAINTWTERHVAVKLLRVDTALSDTVIQRFLREGKLAGRLEHRNVVQVLDMGQADDGALYIVQELLRGTDLRRWLREEKRTVEEALAVVIPIADALIAAHAVALVHRDVKPENIFLSVVAGSDEVTPKLIDFGIALDARTPDARLTASGATIGTASYMPPEQARGADEVGPASDVWSLGAVLFEMLTGRVPFVGNTYNVVIAKLLTEDAPRLDAIDPAIAPELASIVERALARDLSTRFESMRAFRDELSRWADAHKIKPVALQIEPSRGPSPRPITAQDLAKLTRSSPSPDAREQDSAQLNSWVSSPTELAHHTDELPKHVTEAITPQPTHSTLASSVTRDRKRSPQTPRRPWLLGATLLALFGSIASVAVVNRRAPEPAARVAVVDSGIALATQPSMTSPISTQDASAPHTSEEPSARDAGALLSTVADAASTNGRPRTTSTVAHTSDRATSAGRDAGRASEPHTTAQPASATTNGANGSPLPPAE